MVRIALVHYHLRTGGVARVLENTIATLQAQPGFRAALLCGETALDAPWIAKVPGLGYLEHAEPAQAETLAATLVRSASAMLGGSPSIWHVHNPGIGKNVLLPAALDLLIRNGARVLFHIHDFAENGRPRGYALFPQSIRRYPQGPGLHYAAVNLRDASILKQAGIPARRVHWLPNPVHFPFPPPAGPRPQGERDLWFYPVRGIRRKNLGETVLLGLLGKPFLDVATSLAPENPVWLPQHRVWERVAAARAPNVTFAVSGRIPAPGFPRSSGRPSSFESWLSASSAILTTSIGEGFGFAFLEPALFNRPLTGRDLPSVTAELAQAGIRWPLLYERIDVPLTWIGETVLRDRIARLITAHYQAYAVPEPPEAFAETWESMIQPNCADFGCLPEDLQESLIARTAAQSQSAALSAFRVRISGSADYPSIGDWFSTVRRTVQEPLSTGNRDSIETLFGLNAYAARLVHTYAEILQDGPYALPCDSAEEVEAKVLEAFLRPRFLHFLTSDSIPPR